MFPQRDFVRVLGRTGKQVGGCLVKKGETLGSATKWMRWWEGQEGAGTPRSCGFRCELKHQAKLPPALPRQCMEMWQAPAQG